jgi:hypothetical protein
MQIAGAVTSRASRGRDNGAKGPPLTRVESHSGRPVPFADADKEMDRAAAAVKLASELKAAPHRL